MSEFDNNDNEIYDEMPFKPKINNVPDKNKPVTRVCTQCKHFYTRIDRSDGHTSGLDEHTLHVSPDDIRNSDEIRLCYEIHWCNAASLVCDDNFEPLTVDKQAINKLQINDLLTRVKRIQKMWSNMTSSCEPLQSTMPKPQKEIRYVYIGLLQQSPDGELVEVPTEIDGVATNYRRVEMGPLDWDLFYQERDGSTHSHIFIPNTAENAIDIDFPVAQTEWCGLSHFGLYDLPVGGRLISTSEFIVCMDIRVGNCAAITMGVAEIPLELLTETPNKRKERR